MSIINKEKGFVLNAVDVLLSPFIGGKKSGKYFRLNTTQVQLTPPDVETGSIVGTGKDNKGQTLAQYEQDITPMSLTIDFNYASPRAFAMAFGADIEEFAQEAGSVIDEEVVNLESDQIGVLNFGLIKEETFDLQVDDKSLEAGKDYILDVESGTIRAVGDSMKSGKVKATYDYFGSEGVVYNLGTSNLYEAEVKTFGINAITGQMVNVVVHKASFTPSSEVSLMGSEPVAPSVTGEALAVLGKKSPVQLREISVKDEEEQD